jgi:hypothetical protein
MVRKDLDDRALLLDATAAENNDGVDTMKR